MSPTPEPTRIMHVVFSLEPGGMENGVVNVSNALLAEGFETHICCLERSGEFAARLNPSHAVHVLDKQPGFSFRTTAALSRLISSVRPHLVHSHNLGPLIYSGLATGMGWRRPILHGEHGLLDAEDCRPKRLRQRKWFYRGCRGIYAVSGELRRQLVDLGLPGARITVLPNAVDSERFAPASKAKARLQIGGLPQDAFVLGIIGRFGRHKRHAVLIEAFEKLAARRPGAHLLIVGAGGPEEQRVRGQAQASPAAARIHLAGFQNFPQPFYHAMDLLVVPSVNEGMANAVLEAMSCAVAVLAHRVCGNAEMITDGLDGFVTDLNTVEKLDSELEKIIAMGPQLGAIGDAARQTVIKRFPFTNMSRDYSRLYRQLARNGKLSV